jgi:hypothetical protein
MQAPRMVAAAIAATFLCATPAVALGPGEYAVRCGPAETARGEAGSYIIRMDQADLLTLKNSLGTIISGTSVEDGRRVILTGDRGCALVEVQQNKTRK